MRGARKLTLLLALAALAIVGAGCGSSSGGGGTEESSEAPSKPELIRRADAICKKGEESLQGEANEFAKENGIDTSKPTKAQQEEVIEKVVAPALRKQAEELRELGAPSGEEAAVDKVFSALESGTSELEKEPGKLLQGKNPLEEASKLAKEYGFTECGNGG